MKKILLTLILGIVGLSANAYTEYSVPDDNNPSFIFDVIAPGESFNDQTSTFLIPYDYVVPILESAYNWTDILNFGNLHAAEYIYKSDDVLNAFAVSPYVKYKVSGVLQPYKVTAANAALHGWEIVDPGFESIQAEITVGTGLDEVFTGWQSYTGKHALYHKVLPDLYAVMNHEIMHSIGISSAAEQFHKADPVPDDKYYFSSSLEDPLSVYDNSMRIYTGPAPAPIPIDPLGYNTFLANEFGPNQNMTNHDPEYVPIGTEDGQYNVRTYSPYLVCEKVITVLGGDDVYDTARKNIINKGGLLNYSSSYYKYNDPATTAYPTVYGMPVHPFDDETSYDLSHLELRNSYMSHQDFRNWLIPMEAELAVLIDCGFTEIDLRRHFGKSYYLNGNGSLEEPAEYSDGFGERVGNSYSATLPSMVDQAVGIHIYGNNNYILQNGKDILIGKVGEEDGEGAFGVRIDGVQNNYTLASNIYTNGKENIGIGVTWGNNHTVNINGGSKVVAGGKDGIAVSFDFGANLFGRAANEFVKGSYINHYKMGNPPIMEHTVDPENQGPLVKEFNVNGTLEGSKAAIYIADNAHVETINIKDGAHIKGDIISEWNSVSSMGIAEVQTPTTKYTDLKFSGTVDMNGNITGDNSIQNTLNMKNTGTINFSGEEINVNSLDSNGNINISQNAVIASVNNTITGIGSLSILNNASLGLSSNITNIENAVSLDSATLNTANGSVGTTTFSNLTLSGDNSMDIDVDIASQTSDILKFNNPADLTVNPEASLNISNVNLINATKPYTNEKYDIPFISATDNNQNLIGAVSFAGINNVLTPIFKYNLNYTEDALLNQGGFSFSRGKTRDYNSYNPAIAASPVAAQMGGYLSQLNSYEQAFQNLDMKMLMTREERQAFNMANRYASEVQPRVFSPTYLPEKDKGAWFRPYATFEKVGLSNGPKVESISYGSYFGGDSPMFSTKNGWDYQYSFYAGYNGSHQNYSGNSIYQNGGTLGLTGIWYKGDFFTSLTANVGAGVADASTMYGSEDITMFMTGVASKTGYNWELAKGKFIIQPSFLMSYSFVNTFDYTNAAGVKIKSDPLNAINIAPGLKFIGNLKNGWQPYIGMQMVWNIMDKTDFRANDVALPDMSVKPYFQYGIGIQKRWGEKFTGFFQTMFRNGGRTGIALSLGFRWTFGK